MIGVEGGVSRSRDAWPGNSTTAGFRIESSRPRTSLPGSGGVGDGSAGATDGGALSVVAGDATWTLFDTARRPVLGVRRRGRSGPRPIREPNPGPRPRGSSTHRRAATCVVTADRADPPFSDAPIYPHMVELYPLGEFDCRLPDACPRSSTCACGRRTAQLPRLDAFSSSAVMSSSKAAAKLATPSRSSWSATSSMSTPTSGELGPDGFGLVHVGIDAAGDGAVVDEGVERGVGQGVDGVGTDQLVDIQRVAVGGVLRSGRGPERPLDACPRRARARPSVAPENFSWNSL